MSKVYIPESVRRLGHHVVSYMLNISDEDARRLLWGDLKLDAPRQEVLERYIQKCASLRNNDQYDSHTSLVMRLSFLIDNEQHVFSSWRRELGGTSQQELEGPDPLLSQLKRLGMAIYPVLLLNSANQFPHFVATFTTLPANAKLAASYAELREAFIHDESLGKLFRDPKGNLRKTVEYASSVGRGGTLSLDNLPETLIAKAYEVCQMSGAIAPQVFLAKLDQELALLRNLVEGKAVEVLVQMGFHNAGIGGIEFDTAFGSIRKYPRTALDLLRPEHRPSNFGDDSLGFILERKAEYRLWFDVSMTEHEESLAHMRKIFSELNEVEKNFSAAFALAIKRNPVVGITRAWIYLHAPISLGAYIVYKFNPYSPMNHHLLTDDDSRSITKWCSRLVKPADQSMTLAMHRIASCVGERLDPIDGFIDAVIALESLFGRSGEIKFRMSMAIARLLEGDYESRERLQKIVGKLYDDRSSIVHGSKMVPYSEAAELRDRAIEIALRCLDVIYESRQELITASDRSKRILLQ